MFIKKKTNSGIFTSEKYNIRKKSLEGHHKMTKSSAPVLLFITQSWLTLCNLRDYSPPGSSVHGIHQARILEWVAIPFSRGSSRRRDWTCISTSPALQADALPSEPPGKPMYSSCVHHAQLLQSCPILHDPMDGSLPGSSVHGVIQARILEWVAMPSSRGSSWPRDWTNVSCGSCIAGRFFTTEPPGKPHILLKHT